MYLALQVSYALTLFLALPAGALLLRLFVLQHDCGHGSLFRSRLANDMTGRLLAFPVVYPLRLLARRARAASYDLRQSG